jgi:hypothetical protein
MSSMKSVAGGRKGWKRARAHGNRETLESLSRTGGRSQDWRTGDRHTLTNRAEMSSDKDRDKRTKKNQIGELVPRQNLTRDFEAQITNPHSSVLRLKLGNPTPPWFCGSTQKHNTDFEAKPGEIVATIFEGKLKKTVATGFEAKTEKTVSGVLRLNHWQTVAIDFEDQTDEKPFE